MQEQLKNQAPTQIDDLDDFFVSESQTDASVVTQSDITEVSVPEAAQFLGISERSVWRRISKGSLSSRLDEGRTLVSVRQSDASLTPPSIVRAVSVSRHDRQTDMSEHQLEKLFELLQYKDRELQAATYRNGYLESQLETHMKLLPDLQAEAGKAKEQEKRLRELETELANYKQTWWYKTWQMVRGK